MLDNTIQKAQVSNSRANMDLLFFSDRDKPHVVRKNVLSWNLSNVDQSKILFLGKGLKWFLGKHYGKKRKCWQPEDEIYVMK